MNSQHDEASVSLNQLRQLNHDLRGPLNALGGTASMLLEGVYGELSAKQLRAVERLQRNSSRMLTMLDHFMLYHRALARQIDIEDKAIEVAPFLEQLLRPVRDLLTKQPITITVRISDALPALLEGDSNLWTHVLQPLFWNAAAFTISGSINILADWHDEHLLVDVRDSGSGIESGLEANIFIPFFKGAGAHNPPPTSGNGMGLAVAQAIAQMLGGGLELVETGSSGSLFRASLPAAHVMVDPPQGSQPLARQTDVSLSDATST
jgi:signal transduction histidine kinase